MDLSPDGGDPGLVSEEGVHGDAVLDDEGGDGDEGQHEHVQDEELLAIGGGGVNVVAANPPHSVLHTLRQHSAGVLDKVYTSYPTFMVLLLVLVLLVDSILLMLGAVVESILLIPSVPGSWTTSFSFTWLLTAIFLMLYTMSK